MNKEKEEKEEDVFKVDVERVADGRSDVAVIVPFRAWLRSCPCLLGYDAGGQSYSCTVGGEKLLFINLFQER